MAKKDKDGYPIYHNRYHNPLREGFYIRRRRDNFLAYVYPGLNEDGGLCWIKMDESGSIKKRTSQADFGNLYPIVQEYAEKLLKEREIFTAWTRERLAQKQKESSLVAKT